MIKNSEELKIYGIKNRNKNVLLNERTRAPPPEAQW